jgi:UDP-N-acetyl-D-galactosamine dehydrogenase
VPAPYFRGASPEEVKHEYGINILSSLPSFVGAGGGFGAIILAVAHNEFLSIDLKQHQKAGAIIYDVKGILDSNFIDGRL